MTNTSLTMYHWDPVGCDIVPNRVYITFLQERRSISVLKINLLPKTYEMKNLLNSTKILKSLKLKKELHEFTYQMFSGKTEAKASRLCSNKSILPEPATIE